MSRLFVAAMAVALVHQSARGEDCPCLYREADPLFPGEGGFRWDCEYVGHGLQAVPSSCWALHPNVTQVFLDYNRIDHLAVDAFAGLDDLRTLSLKKNAIRAVPEGAFAGLASLRFLDVSGNGMANPPADLWGLTELTHLYLSENEIAEGRRLNISRLVNLEVLDLHLNRLSRLPYRCLEPLTRLRRLRLHWNLLTELPALEGNLLLEEVLVNGNALLDFPKHVFGRLAGPLTYHFVDNPAYDVWASMLLPLPDRSHVVMGNDVSVWAEDDAQAEELLSRSWLVQDGLSQDIDLAALVRVCRRGRLPPC